MEQDRPFREIPRNDSKVAAIWDAHRRIRSGESQVEEVIGDAATVEIVREEMPA